MRDTIVMLCLNKYRIIAPSSETTTPFRTNTLNPKQKFNTTISDHIRIFTTRLKRASLKRKYRFWIFPISVEPTFFYVHFNFDNAMQTYKTRCGIRVWVFAINSTRFLFVYAKSVARRWQTCNLKTIHRSRLSRF